MLIMLSMTLIMIFFINKTRLYVSYGFLFFMLLYSLLMTGNNALNLNSYDYSFMGDFTGWNLMSLTVLISILMLILSHKIYLLRNMEYLYKICILTLTLMLLVLFSCNNIIIFYMLFEASLIPTFMLVMLWGYQPERILASFFLLMYTIISSLPLLLGIFFIFNNFYSFSLCIFYDIFKFSLVEYILFFFMTLPFMIKLPIYFFHIWLPKAHVEAPLSGSMILAAILLKLGAIGVIRFSFIIPFVMSKILKLFMSLCILGAIYTSIICTRQTDLKALIAYSSVSHMGTMMAALSLMNSQAWMAAIIMLCAHALGSSLLFSLANASYEYSNSRSMILTKGLLKLSPVISFFWFVGAMMSLGAPPFINFFTEIFITMSVLSNFYFFLPLFIIILFVSAIYSLYLYTATSHGNLMNFSMKTLKLKFNFISSSFLHFTPGLSYMLLMKMFWF